MMGSTHTQERYNGGVGCFWLVHTSNVYAHKSHATQRDILNGFVCVCLYACEFGWIFFFI